MSIEQDFKKEEIIFMQFVMGLSQSGMMQLGKIMNPMTQKIEKDINAAGATIDMLCMLREKTKGNLSKYEEDILANSISSLQMNYIDEQKAESGEENVDQASRLEKDGEQKTEAGEENVDQASRLEKDGERKAEAGEENVDQASRLEKDGEQKPEDGEENVGQASRLEKDEEQKTEAGEEKAKK